MVDYLFLTKNVARIQATTHTKNVISGKVLEKVGFKRKCTLRKPAPIWGEWTNMFIFSILEKNGKNQEYSQGQHEKSDKTCPNQ